MTREQMVRNAHFLLRIVAGWMIFQAGASKLFGWFGGMPAGSTLNTQTTIGAVIEVAGGFLVLIGLGTRISAFILSGQMAVAYFQFHQPNGTWPLQNGGVPAVLFCFIFLYLAAAGGGVGSTDDALAKKSGSK